MQPDAQTPSGIKVQLLSTVLADDGVSLVQTYTSNLTQAQLTSQLAQAMVQLSNLQNQVTIVNGNIAKLQTQLALFPVVKS